MGPKKATGAAATSKEKKPAASASHSSYHDMIKEAILNLKERNGSSRQAIKKYVRANNKVNTASETQFDSLFNRALKSGAEKGDFSQPKGPSGPVKLAKKEAVKKEVAKKPAAPKKEKSESKPKVTKAPAAKKSASAKPKATKSAAPKSKKSVSKPKANTKAKTTKPAKTEAPAVPIEEPKPAVLKKTSSGRISKQKTTSGGLKKAPAKASKKVAKPSSKKATPKKA